jgi:hypothetical protein
VRLTSPHSRYTTQATSEPRFLQQYDGTARTFGESDLLVRSGTAGQSGFYQVKVAEFAAETVSPIITMVSSVALALSFADTLAFTRIASKQELDGLKEAVQLAVSHGVNEFNDKKRDRYVKIIGNALHDEKHVDDLASYIRDVEQFGESDFAALRVLNKVVNKPGDWNVNLESNVHPGLFIQRRQELAVQTDQALGVRVEKPAFSREEGYDVSGAAPISAAMGSIGGPFLLDAPGPIVRCRACFYQRCHHR